MFRWVMPRDVARLSFAAALAWYAARLLVGAVAAVLSMALVFGGAFALAYFANAPFWSLIP